MKGLLKTADIKRFFERNGESFAAVPLSVYLAELLREKDLIREHVINCADIERTYGHQIFRGVKNPSRDSIIKLAFGFRLSVPEAQELLRAARKSALYPRIKRDAAVLFCLGRNMGVTEAQSLLSELRLTLLGEGDRRE
jgi:hypothetical protein